MHLRLGGATARLRLRRALVPPRSRPAPAAMSSSPRPADPAGVGVPEGHQLVTEGQVTMVYPRDENSVFYNPVQVQNRDLSVLMIGVHARMRAERRWSRAKRKELRRAMLQAQRDEVGEDELKNEGKEQRKARAARFERDLTDAVNEAREGVDFDGMTAESAGTDDGMTIFEALAASGLRSLRYWKEVPGVRAIVVNDLDPVAVEMCRENVVRNGLEGALAGQQRQDGGPPVPEAEDGDASDVMKAAGRGTPRPGS